MDFRGLSITLLAIATGVLLSSSVDCSPFPSPSFYSSSLTATEPKPISHRISMRDTTFMQQQHQRTVTYSKCDTSIEMRELCQRCAKVTKSPRALKMCCFQEEETDIWCQKFLNYGQQRPPNSVSTGVISGNTLS